MTEEEARATLRAFVAVGEIEHWIAAQPWEPAPGGCWIVAGDRQGWRFRLEPVAGGVRVVASVPDDSPAAWTVPAAEPRQ